MTLFGEARDRWRAHVCSLADSGYYADDGRAHRYVTQRILPLWQEACEAPDAAQSYRITPTLERILHLFGRGVLGHGMERGKTPRVRCWPPARLAPGSEAPTFYKVVPKKDVARIVGASTSAVREAFRRIRGRGADPGLQGRGLCAIVSQESGIHLDGLFDRQLPGPFALLADDYERGRLQAQAQESACGRYARAQVQWCEAGRASKGLIRRSRRSTATARPASAGALRKPRRARRLEAPPPAAAPRSRRAAAASRSPS